METKNLLELNKQVEGLIKDFKGMDIDIVEATINNGQIWLLFDFSYCFIKTMIRGNFEPIEEIAWTKMTFKKDNVFFTTYEPR